MNWAVFALISAALWGLSYVFSEKLLSSISAASLMLYTSFGTLFIYAAMAVYKGNVFHDWEILKKGGTEFKYIIIIILVNAFANLFILFSLKDKNATAVGLVEISYPIFTALFAWLIFRENQLSAGTLIGGALIMSGVICIAYFDKIT